MNTAFPVGLLTNYTSEMAFYGQASSLLPDCHFNLTFIVTDSRSSLATKAVDYIT